MGQRYSSQTGEMGVEMKTTTELAKLYMKGDPSDETVKLMLQGVIERQELIERLAPYYDAFDSTLRVAAFMRRELPVLEAYIAWAKGRGVE